MRLKPVRFLKKLMVGLVLAVAFFLVANFNWSHGALVAMITKAQCPEHMVLQAKIDALQLFASYSASPVWLCLKKPVLGLDVSHGSTRSALFLPSIIVIGKKGPRRNVMAHEYAHAELVDRLKARYFLVPTWFDEGLAMQVDRRRAYSQAALKRYLKRKGVKPPSLDKLGSSRRFYKRDKAMLNYAFASCVVKKWLKSNGTRRLLELIDRIGWLKPFPSEKFRKFERQCLRH